MDKDVTRILSAIDAGDPSAAEQLLPLVYDELRRLGAQKLRQERANHTLQPTALVHEAFLRLVGAYKSNASPDQKSAEAASTQDAKKQTWDSRGHFFAAAAEAMRRILIENARQKKSEKRGGKLERKPLDEGDALVRLDDYDTLLSLDDALDRLEKYDADLARLVQLRYFAGLTIDATAEILGVSPRTTKRNWAFARAWLRRAIESE
ncbi:MAG: ECF-type sigma factor [Aureliella sp.]